MLHDHDFLEIAYIRSGVGRHASAEGVHPLAQGDVVVVTAGNWHGYQACERLQVTNCLVALELMHQLRFLQHDAALAGLLGIGTGYPGIGFLRLGGAHRTAFEEVLSLGGRPLDGSGPEEVAGMLRLLAVLRQEVADSSPAPPDLRRHPAVLNAIALFDQDLAHPWTLGEVARRVAVDPSYLSRLFQRQLQITPMGYLHRRRLD
jgi:AraC family L-rhamnose operon transcriptional activator RhaR